jgi:uncharacterized protein YndB with AHSA1/START domain
MGENLHHATVNLEHSYGVPVARVFSEFADPTARVRWSAPSGDTLVYDSAEFREGGGDVFRCGAAERSQVPGRDDVSCNRPEQLRHLHGSPH